MIGADLTCNGHTMLTTQKWLPRASGTSCASDPILSILVNGPSPYQTPCPPCTSSRRRKCCQSRCTKRTSLGMERVVGGICRYQRPVPGFREAPAIRNPLAHPACAPSLRGGQRCRAVRVFQSHVRIDCMGSINTSACDLLSERRV